MNWRSKSSPTLLLAVALLLPVTPGCSILDGTTVALASLTGKQTADYDAVEANRQSQAEHADASELLARHGTPPTSGFRGPESTGVYRARAQATTTTDTVLLEVWPKQGLQELWRQPIGAGYSSFAIAGDLAITQEQRRTLEVVAAYDVSTGHEIWVHGYEARFSEAFAGEGPRATPLYHDNRVYAVGATGVVRCIDATNGHLIWGRDLVEEHEIENLEYGTAASPMIAAGHLIVAVGEPHDDATHSLFALDLDRGETIWSALPDTATYSSPMRMTLAGREQIVAIAYDRVVGIAPESGEELWSQPWKVFLGTVCAQPVQLSENSLMVSGGYGAGTLAFEIVDSDGAFKTSELWTSKALKNKFSTSMHLEDSIFGLDEYVFACIDAKTGKRRWKKGRYGYGQLLRVGKMLILLSGKGELCSLRPNSEELEEVGRFRALDGNTWTVPAIAGNRIILRNAAEMVCYDLTTAAKAEPEID